MMEKKTTDEILDEWENQTGNPPYPLESKEWVSVESLSFLDSNTDEELLQNAKILIKELKGDLK